LESTVLTTSMATLMIGSRLSVLFLVNELDISYFFD
jgi:hypothetical protein